MLTEQEQTTKIRHSWIKGFCVLALIGVLVYAYWPVLFAEARSIDDHQYLTENTLVTQPSVESVIQILTEVLRPSQVQGYYHPLSQLSLMLDYLICQTTDSLFMYHLTNLVLHISNVLLVLLFFYLLSGRFWTSLVIALLYGLHPVNADSVVWVAQRKTLLAIFFGLLMLNTYLAYNYKKHASIMIGVLVFYVLALLASPTVIMLPFVVVLLDVWPLKRFSVKTMLEKIPLFVVFFIWASLTFLSQQRAQPVEPVFAESILKSILIVAYDHIFYIAHFLVPLHMCAYYPPPELTYRSIPLVLDVLFTVLLVTGMALLWRKTRSLLVGWLFFIVAILPTMGLVRVTDVLTANRFMGLAMLGLFLPLAVLCNRFFYRPLTNKWLLYCRPVVTMIVVGLLGTAQIGIIQNYLGHWKTTETHDRYLISQAPNQARFYSHLAAYLRQQDRLEESVDTYKKALAVDPNSFADLNYTAQILDALHRPEEALGYYEAALQVQPENAAVRYNTAVVLARLDRHMEAIGHYRTALIFDRTYTFIYPRLALSLAAIGETDAAIHQFENAIRENPDAPELYCNVGILLEQKGNLAEAVQYYQQALKTQPQHSRSAERLKEALAKIQSR